MRIGGIDRNRTKSLQKKFVRKQASTKICLKSDNNPSKMPEQELMLSTSSDSETSVSFPEKLHKNIEEPLPSTSGTMEYPTELVLRLLLQFNTSFSKLRRKRE